MPRCNNNEGLSGFTHYRVIDHDDMIAALSSSSDTTVTIPVIEIPAQSYVKDVGLYFVELFSSDSAEVSVVNVAVGDETDPDGYILDVASGLHFNNGAYFKATDSGSDTINSVVKGKKYTAQDTIDVVMRVSIGTGGLGAAIRGKLIVAANILNIASFV